MMSIASSAARRTEIRNPQHRCGKARADVSGQWEERTFHRHRPVSGSATGTTMKLSFSGTSKVRFDRVTGQTIGERFRVEPGLRRFDLAHPRLEHFQQNHVPREGGDGPGLRRKKRGATTR